MFGHTLVSCLCLVNNTSVFSSFTPILLTVFSTSVSRGRLFAPLWEQPSSQPLGSWPTSKSMFDKGRVSPRAKDGELERLSLGERATRKARGCPVHIPRQTNSQSEIVFPCPNNENNPAYRLSFYPRLRSLCEDKQTVVRVRGEVAKGFGYYLFVCSRRVTTYLLMWTLQSEWKSRVLCFQVNKLWVRRDNIEQRQTLGLE